MTDTIYSGYKVTNKQKYFSNQALLELFLRNSKYNIKIIENGKNTCYPKGIKHVIIDDIPNSDCEIILNKIDEITYKIKKNTINLPIALLELICTRGNLEYGFTAGKDKFKINDKDGGIEEEYSIEIE